MTCLKPSRRPRCNPFCAGGFFVTPALGFVIFQATIHCHQGAPMKFGYAAASLQDIADHILNALTLEERSHESRGMRNPHDAYVAGYNKAVNDVHELLSQTTIVDTERKG